MPDNIRILFLGDIIGRPGRRSLLRFIDELRERHAPHLVVANGENAAGGIGITEAVGGELLEEIDVLTSGNHIWDKKEAVVYLENEPRILRPANYPAPCPGKGSGIFSDSEGRPIGIINLQGRVFMEPVDCPFRRAEEEIDRLKKETPVILVDFHAEATSEKQALGWFLDGRVTAVIGTHTHVQTADERILPQGTAFISDCGMVGGADSVIGIRREQAMQRFLTARPQRFEPEKKGCLLAGVRIDVDASTGKALAIQRELKIEDS